MGGGFTKAFALPLGLLTGSGATKCSLKSMPSVSDPSGVSTNTNAWVLLSPNGVSNLTPSGRSVWLACLVLGYCLKQSIKFSTTSLTLIVATGP